MQQLAPQAIASAVEDTVRRLGELDEATLENPTLLEAAVTEAFHEAAAENFLLGGSDPPIYGLIPSDIVFRGNTVVRLNAVVLP